MYKYHMVIILSLMLTNCIIKPNEKYNSSIFKELSYIELSSSISSNYLDFASYFTDLIPYSITKKYLIKIKFVNDIGEPLILIEDTNVLKQKIINKVKYKLFKKSTMKILTEGEFCIFASYDNCDSAYNSYINHEVVQKKLFIEAAEKLRDILILYFNSNNS